MSKFRERLEEQARKDPRYLPGDMIAIEIGARAALLLAADMMMPPANAGHNAGSQRLKCVDELRARAEELKP